MVEFAGYEMPLQYSSIREEHVAVRTRAGLFDLSHMGEVRIRGAGALRTTQRLLTNDALRASEGAAIYSVMCNERGGIIDDVVAYHTNDDWLLVVNASCRAKDIAWMRKNADDAEVDDQSDATALLAVQGPRALQIVQRLMSARVDEIASFHFVEATVAGVRALVSRTGYTGEDGVELYVDAAAAGDVWDSVMASGRDEDMIPCGLGARDTLRLEAGLRLYGQDMDEDTDPYSCGLGWTVKLDKGEFNGADALRRLDPKHPPHRFIGLRLPARSIARHGNEVSADGEIGRVTSGTFSFTLGYGIATASVTPDVPPGVPLTVNIRGATIAAERVPLPFYRRSTGA